jgi:cytochrome c
MMRIRLFHTRMAVVLMAAAVFLSGCYHWMSPHSRMDRSAAKSSWQVTKADRPGYTVAMVEKALRLYDAKGREATVAYYNSPQSVDGEWYVFIADENNDIIAHPNPGVVGDNLLDETGVDITGYRQGEVIASATEEGKWVDYIFLNLATGKQEYKHAWVVRHDGLIFVSGWYQVLPGLSLGVTKAQPAEYTVAMVDKALRYYKAHGRAETVAYYNTPESVDGAWYVFIVDENDIVIAHANPELLGQDLKEDLGLDSAGYRFGEDMLKATEEGLWVDYVFVNPATGAEETKHAWTVRHDGVLIGSGWYE